MVVLLSIFVLTQQVAASPLEAVAGMLFPTPTNTVAQKIDLLSQRLGQAERDANLAVRIDALKEWVELAPNDATAAEQLAEAYYEQGLILRNDRDFEAAQSAFNHALAIQETMETALLEKQQINLYLEGVEYYQNGDWPQAIKALAEIYRQTPTYPNLNEILYSAYFNQGMAQQAMNQLKDARKSFEQAAEILPDVPEAGQKAKEVALLLNPPTPTPFPNLPTPAPTDPGKKQVVVDISEQRAYTYLNDEVVHKFIISTGEPGRDTAVGSFEIQNKIPVAYASTWNLDMPYWLGIYYSGPLQNGFHAVPTVRSTGLTMWDGYLGQRVSYGCVILSLADAETLYDWVDIGTPVNIQW
jgi:tetratricopeptide (TPR) repeat protein